MGFLLADRKLGSVGSRWLHLRLQQLLLLLCVVTELASCGKILILHPLYSGSHVLTLSSVAEALTQRGHTVHVVRWKDAHIFPAQNNPNITTTTLAMDNSNGLHAFLSHEKQAAFQVRLSLINKTTTFSFWNTADNHTSCLPSPVSGAI